MADTATFSGAMKTKFIGPIRDGMHQGMVLLYGGDSGNPEGFQGIPRMAENIDFVGNEFRIPLKTSRNQAVGFRSENEDLPAAGASAYTYLTEPMRYAYGRFNITGQLMKASETNEGAFKSAFKQEMEDTTLTAKIDHNRAAWGDGSGKMATVRTGYTAPGTGVIDFDTTINIRGGEYVDFVNAAGTVISPAHKIIGIDRTNRTLTVNGTVAANLTTSHFIVRASSNSTIAVPNNSQNKEFQGIGSIVSSTGTLHTVNPTTYPFWASYQKAIGGAITDAAVRDLKDGIGFEAGINGDGDSILISDRGIRRRYADTLTSVKRFNDAQSVKLHGGFTALMFDEQPWFVDDYSPIGQVTLLSVKDLFWAQMSDWDWMDQDGKVLKWETNKDRYTAVLYKYSQLGTTRRNAHGKLTGVTDDVR
jgi:hypothetical protein